MKLSALAILAVLVAALFVAGCGGGSRSGGSSSEPGAAKKATAPNAPAGSKVVSCGMTTGGMAQLRATMIDCGTARQMMMRWGRRAGCALGKSESRGSCSLGGFRCQAVRVDRGTAVSCARPGGDVSFVAKSR